MLQNGYDAEAVDVILNIATSKIAKQIEAKWLEIGFEVLFLV